MTSGAISARRGGAGMMSCHTSASWRQILISTGPCTASTDRSRSAASQNQTGLPSPPPSARRWRRVACRFVRIRMASSTMESSRPLSPTGTIVASRAPPPISTRRRGNLTIMAGTHVEGIVMDGRRAEGVRVVRDGDSLLVRARRVIVTAGAVQSPAMLLRAGIGPPAELRALGIDVAIVRGGVGSNLRDHPALTFCQFLPPPLRLPLSRRRASFVALRYSSGCEGCDRSDMYVTAAARAGWHRLGTRLGLYFLWCNRPYSAGRVFLVSPEPGRYPSVELNLLDDPRDLRRMMDAVRLLASLVINPVLNEAADDFFPASFSPRIKRLSAFNRRNGAAAAVMGAMLDLPAKLRHVVIRRLLLNGVAFADVIRDEHALADFVRRSVFGVWHPTGTCRMGDPSDPNAVVDPRGQVIGSENLYVADASVMPRLPTANTNIPTIMIAEKISAGLLSCSVRTKIQVNALLIPWKRWTVAGPVHEDTCPSQGDADEAPCSCLSSARNPPVRGRLRT